MNRALCCLLMAVSCQAGAGEPLAPDARSGVEDAGAQELRYQIFQALADARFVLDARDMPATDRVNVYIGQTGLAHRSLQQLRFTVDEGTTQLADVAPATAAAISDYGDRWRILRQTLAPGPHVIRAEFAITDPDTSGDTPVVMAVTHRFEKMPGELDLEFRLDAGLITAPAIKVRELVRDDRAPRTLMGVAVDRLALPVLESSRYHSGSDADPAISHSRALIHMGDADSALVELLEVALQSGPEASLAPGYWLDTVRALRSLGMLDEAERICDQLDQHRKAKADVASERLHLAEARHSAGDLVQTERLLQLADAALPELRRPDWRQLYGRVLIARQRPAEAAAMFGKEDQTVEAFRFMVGSIEAVRAAAYSRYNLAVAMLRNGDEARGLSWLDLLGRNVASDPQLKALRDKANLALGWHFLKAGQGRTALGVLGRVPVDGLLADRALLGMGWAMLAPNGARQPRVDLDLGRDGQSRPSNLPAPLQASLLRLRVLEPELNGAGAPSTIERDLAPKNRSDALRAAITVWQPLLLRDERSTAVLEGRLAIAYAHDQLGDATAAREAYRDAIGALRRVEADLALQRSQIASGALRSAVGAGVAPSMLYQTMDRLQLPFDDRSAALYARLDESLRWQRLDLALRAVVERRDTSVDGDYVGTALAADAPVLAESRLLERIADQREQLLGDAQAEALQLLDDRAGQWRQYLAAALFSLARLEDDPALASRDSVDCIRACR